MTLGKSLNLLPIHVLMSKTGLAVVSALRVLVKTDRAGPQQALCPCERSLCLFNYHPTICPWPTSTLRRSLPTRLPSCRRGTPSSASTCLGVTSRQTALRRAQLGPSAPHAWPGLQALSTSISCHSLIYLPTRTQIL